MRQTLASGLLLVIAVATGLAQAPAGRPTPPPAVKEGQPAPDFTLNYLVAVADDRPQPKAVTLGAFRGKQPVVLAFFPAAFSPG